MPLLLTHDPGLDVLINPAGVMVADDPTRPIDDDLDTAVMTTNLLAR